MQLIKMINLGLNLFNLFCFYDIVSFDDLNIILNLYNESQSIREVIKLEEEILEREVKILKLIPKVYKELPSFFNIETMSSVLEVQKTKIADHQVVIESLYNVIQEAPKDVINELVKEGFNNAAKSITNKEQEQAWGIACFSFMLLY